MYQPKMGESCYCRRGTQRDNCITCEGTGWRIDFRDIRNHCRDRVCHCGRIKFVNLKPEDTITEVK